MPTWLSTPLGAVAGLPAGRILKEWEADCRAEGRHRGSGTCDQVSGVDDERAKSLRFAHCAVDLLERPQANLLDAHIRPQRVVRRNDLRRTADEEDMMHHCKEASVCEDLGIAVIRGLF